MVTKMLTREGTEVELQDGINYIMPPFASYTTAAAQLQQNKYVFIIWMVVLGILGLTVLLFGYLAFKNIGDEKNAVFLMAPATTALGAIVGLLAPSPTK